MGEKSEDERRENAGYGSEETSRAPNGPFEPSECIASVEATREEKERAAKLADLRERKAKLLEAKAQAAKLLEAKERAAKLAAKEHEAHLEDGKQRGLRGFALVEHAANLAEAKKREREAKFREAREENNRANASDSHDQECSEVMLTEKKMCETELREPNEQCVTSCTADKGCDCQEAGENENERQEQDCENSTDEDCQEAVDAPGCNSDPSLGFLHFKKTRAQVEQNEEQKAETERRKQQAEFLARQPAKTKSINRKGHHAFGRQKNRLATGSKS
eukprot:TRINITY_DN30077_c0_g1_i1.p1 TRINITY_DN30077_c0_g1~~TRINITY_DN30077_c0_g1_i1.p1  ORF type:complete len:277 (-),score=75.06 TRINITY_DN30077_c0_g1_i1:538-1368(-)